MCDGTPLSDFNPEFVVLVSTTTGSERVRGGSDGGEFAISDACADVVLWFKGK